MNAPPMPGARGGGMLRLCVVAIGLVTVASGALQLAQPGLILTLIAGPSSAMARHFFAIVGMFMVLFGGLVLQTLRSESRGEPGGVALLWCTLQKLGASAAVGLGVLSGVFSPIALLVAGFDLASAVLFWSYRLSRASSR